MRLDIFSSEKCPFSGRYFWGGFISEHYHSDILVIALKKMDTQNATKNDTFGSQFLGNVKSTTKTHNIFRLLDYGQPIVGWAEEHSLAQ